MEDIVAKVHTETHYQSLKGDEALITFAFGNITNKNSVGSSISLLIPLSIVF